MSLRGMAAIPTGLLLAVAFFNPTNVEAACAGTAPLVASLPPPPEITVSGAPES